MPGCIIKDKFYLSAAMELPVLIYMKEEKARQSAQEAPAACVSKVGIEW